MAGIRDKLIHDYISVNLEIVWKTVAEDLPVLLSQIERMIQAAAREQSAPPTTPPAGRTPPEGGSARS